MHTNSRLLFGIVAILCWQLDSSTASVIGEFLASAIRHAIVDTTEAPTDVAAETSTYTSTDVPTDVPTNAAIDAGVDGSAASNICTMTVGPSSKTCSCSSPEVDCSHLGITELPSEIVFPQGIRIASFQGNQFENVKYDSFYDGADLLQLDLSHNHINFVSVAAFTRFPKLARLTLSHNGMWNIPVRVFEGLQDLKELDLSHNDIQMIFSDVFKPMKNLKILNLARNPLLEIPTKQFEHLRNLEKLDLTDTLLSIIPDYLFSFTPNLRYLFLSDNQVAEVPSAALKKLKKAHTLDLSGNPIEVLSPGAFDGLPFLSVLFLNRMSKLTTIQNFAFGGLQGLRELHCSFNFALGYIDEGAFLNSTSQKLVTVQQLFLRQNNLMALPKNLQAWNSDMELHVRGNPWYCDCQLRWMTHVKLKNKFQEHMWCWEPYHLRNRIFTTVGEDDLRCGLSYTDVIILSCSLVLGFTIVLLIVSFLVWKRHFSGFNRIYFRISKKTDSDDVVYEKAIDA